MKKEVIKMGLILTHVYIYVLYEETKSVESVKDYYCIWECLP
jgi:hypothetical protein